MDRNLFLQTQPHAKAPAQVPKSCTNLLARTGVKVLLATVVAILIILVAIVSPRVRDCEQYLSGFWSGDPTFLKEAGLSQMYFYLSPCDRLNDRWCRQGYLLMVDSNGTMVSNQGIEITYKGMGGRWKSALKSHFTGGAQETYYIPSVEFGYDVENVMPENMRIGLNVTEGTLALYTDEKIYAFFVKDNETSISANAKYCADGEIPTSS